jgi:hypothetical protein
MFEQKLAFLSQHRRTDGPQKRVVAILDRSSVKKATDKVKIVALYPAPDPW